ncbi:MAG: methyltransferase domain-containing protein [Bacteroidota bacterium]
MKTAFYLSLLFNLFIGSIAAMEDEHKNAVIEWDADFYDQNSNSQFEGGKAFVDQIDLSQASGFLDVGCGTGRMALYLASKYPDLRIVGYDASGNMIKKAHEKLVQAQGQNLNIDFFQADASRFQFGHPQFSHAFSYAVFHFIVNQLQALKNIATGLQDGGALYIMTAANNNSYQFGHAFIETVQDKKWVNFFPANLDVKSLANLVTKEELIEKFKQAGFVNIDVKEVTRQRQYDSKETFINFLLGWIIGLPIVTKFTPEERRLFVEDAVSRYLEKVPLLDGKYTYILPSLAAKAQIKRDESGKIISEDLLSGHVVDV